MKSYPLAFCNLRQVPLADIGPLYSITSSARASKLRWHVETECLGGLEIDHKLELGRLLNRHLAWLDALEDLPDIMEAYLAKDTPAGACNSSGHPQRRTPNSDTLPVAYGEQPAPKFHHDGRRTMERRRQRARRPRAGQASQMPPPTLNWCELRRQQFHARAPVLPQVFRPSPLRTAMRWKGPKGSRPSLLAEPSGSGVRAASPQAPWSEGSILSHCRPVD